MGHRMKMNGGVSPARPPLNSRHLAMAWEVKPTLES